MEDIEPVRGIPIFFDEAESEIDDPANPPKDQHWYPANTITIKLIRCLEAIRDMQSLLKILSSQENPASNRRVTKLLATPLFNLALAVRDMFNDIEGNAREYGQIAKNERGKIKKRFNQFLKEVPLDNTSELKAIRDKISSHIDKDVFRGDARKIWSLVDLKQLLEWMKASLDALMFLLPFDIYAWTRDSGHEDIFRLMSVDGVQVDLNLEEKVIVGVVMARSPKYYISLKIQGVADNYRIIRPKCV